MSSESTAADLGELEEAISGRNDYSAIRAYKDAWDRASTVTKARFLAGLYRTK